jgi:hypothetical protein
MVKTGSAKQKAQTYFEQVPVAVVEEVLGREAVRTLGGTTHLRETAARTMKPHSSAGSIAKAAIKPKGAIPPR